MAESWLLVNIGQLAALIAAGFFAVGMVAAIYVLIRLGALISAAKRMLTDYHGRASALIENANTAVDRAHQQLTRTDSITASMDEVTANMAELSGHISALSGLARGISAGFGTPLLRLSAFAFGIRRAVALRGAPWRAPALESPPALSKPALSKPALSKPALSKPALPGPALPGRAQRRSRRR